MSRITIARVAFTVLSTFPACSLLIDTNPDGVIHDSGASGSDGTDVGGKGNSSSAKGGQATASGAGGTSASSGGANMTSSHGVGATAGVLGTGGASASGGQPMGGIAGQTASSGAGAKAALGGAIGTAGTTTTAVGGASNTGGAPKGGTTSTGGVGTAGATSKGGSVATGGVSTGGVGTGGVGSGGVTAVGDTTPPRVLSIAPTDGALGVVSTAKIEITFSEPMDTISVANALSVAPLAKSALGFAWTTDNTILTITPSAGLQYASGTALATTSAQSYGVNLGVQAKDRAGNALSGPFASSFTTLRRITQTIAPVLATNWDSYSLAMGGSPAASCLATNQVEVGSWNNGHNGGTYYGFLFFDLAPAGTPNMGTQLEQVTMRALQAPPSVSFYPAGSVVVERLDYQELDATILSSIPTATVGNLSTGVVSQPQLDITPWAKSDFQANNLKLLYRLAAAGSPLGEFAYFYCDQFSLRVVSLTP